MTVIRGADTSCAVSRIGIPTYTSEITSFNDAVCATGAACDNATPGIAHRSWPLGSTVMVCKLSPTCLCAPTIIMDRGPANYLGARTIDANPGLTQLLGLNGKQPAIYMLLKAPGVSQSVRGADDIHLEPVAGVQGVNQPGPQPGINGTQSFPPTSQFPQQQPMPMPVSNQFQPQPPPPTGTPTSNSTSSPPSQSSVGPPVGMVLAQPTPVIAGRKITVSWTSVHLSDSQPCQIFINDTQFLAQGNEGTRTTDAGPNGGPQKFTMKCTDQKGAAYEQSDTVTVQ